MVRGRHDISDQIFYLDRSDIHEGNLAEVKAKMSGLAELVDSNMPQLISYGFYIDESAMQMTVVAVHPDSASLETHLQTGGPAFREFAEHINMRKIEVYGQPSSKALDLLHQKAEMLGENASVLVQERYAGFDR